MHKTLAYPSNFPRRLDDIYTRLIKDKILTPDSAKIVSFELKKQSDRSGQILLSDHIRFLKCLYPLHQSQPLTIESVLALIDWAKVINGMESELFQQLFNPDHLASTTPHTLIKVCQVIVELEDHPKIAKTISDYGRGHLTFNQLYHKLSDIRTEYHHILFPEKPIEQVRREFSDKSKLIDTLTSDELDKAIKDYQQIQKLGDVFHRLSDAELKEKISLLQTQDPSKTTLPLLAIAREVISRFFKISPYNTQILTVLSLLNHPENIKGRIAEMRTGEGKSTVITLLTTVLASQDHFVDIVTWSDYLAIRDEIKYKDYYQFFKLSCGHICDNGRTAYHFRHPITFGSVYSFEWAYLDELKTGTPIRVYQNAPKPFDIVIIDEMDDLALDQQSTRAILGTYIPQFDLWLTYPVFHYVKEHLGDFSQRKITPEDIAIMRQFIINRNPQMKKNLTTTTDYKIKVFIENAVTALTIYEDEIDYVIRQGQKLNNRLEICEENCIQLVDYGNTGNILTNRRGMAGMHEFLELKHDMEVGLPIVASTGVSTATFLTFYRHIYGITGTLGCKIEREELHQLYTVDTVDIPPHRPSLRKIYPARYFKELTTFYEYIVSQIAQLKTDGRPVLVLCLTIQETKTLSEALKKHTISHQLLNEIQNEDTEFIVSRGGLPGSVIVATNTAGRGTDFVLSKMSINLKGLHVLMTFFPKNTRVGAQGEGRGGRQGQPGSSQIVVYTKHRSLIDYQLPSHFFDQSDQAIHDQLLRRRDENLIVESKKRLFSSEVEKVTHSHVVTFCQGISKWDCTLSESVLLDIFKEMQKWSKTSTQIQANSDWKMKVGADILTLLMPNAQGTSHAVIISTLNAAKAFLRNEFEVQWAIFYESMNYQQLEYCETHSLLNSQEYSDKIQKAYNQFMIPFLPIFKDPKASFLDHLKSLSVS